MNILYDNSVLLAAALLTGWVLDLIFGDPEWLPHPVVFFGRWIAFWEKRLNRGQYRRAKGAVMAVGSIALTFASAWFVLGLFADANIFTPHSTLHTPHSKGLFILHSSLIFFCLAGHTLRREVRMVFEALDRSLDEGRRQVSRIVGRDTKELSAQEVRTAALETLAENLSDGVVAPLFWLCLLGVPGMLAYKMVNTLDSMVGYRTERYRDFGCWAARIDDFANYIPARITALMIILASRIIPHRQHHTQHPEGLFADAHQHVFTLRSSLSFLFRFGPRHASPNSGWPEAALAGILDCRFGGPHEYFGETVDKPYIGTNPRQLNTDDTRTAIRVCLAAECLCVAVAITTLILL